MPSAATIRLQIEAALADRIPSALTPQPKIIRPVAATGVRALDEVLHGGLPVGAVTEIVGAECSGRLSLSLSFIAQMTQVGKVCAWIDVSNSLDPESAAASGVDLSRLLWVRCGAALMERSQQKATSTFTLPEKCLTPAPIMKGLHGGGFGPHPRGETKGLADAMPSLFNTTPIASPQATSPRTEKAIVPSPSAEFSTSNKKLSSSRKPWSRMDQALRVADSLLQAGGFSAIVLDLGSIRPEFASRVPLTTWFRYRAAAEKSQTSILLLTQHTCAKSCAGLVLRMQSGQPLHDESTVFTGIQHSIEVVRERFKPIPDNVLPLRKPPQSERNVRWQSRTPWAGQR